MLLTIAYDITANLPSSKIQPEVEHGARRVSSFICVDGARVTETETAEKRLVEANVNPATLKILIFHFVRENVLGDPLRMRHYGTIIHIFIRNTSDILYRHIFHIS